jgi:hypothetical protein
VNHVGRVQKLEPAKHLFDDDVVGGLFGDTRVIFFVTRQYEQ